MLSHNDAIEQAFLNGQHAAYRALLGECLRQLPGGERTQAQLVDERTETILLLRTLCAASGDNEWDEHLALPDIIEKHLYRHMQPRERP